MPAPTPWPTFTPTPIPNGARNCPPSIGLSAGLSPANLYDLFETGQETWRAIRLWRGGFRLIQGTTYAGQVLVYGTQEAKAIAGLSPYLTHARGLTHPALVGYLKPGVAAWRSVANWSTLLGVALTVGEDVYTYGWGAKKEVGLRSSEFAAALSVDVALSVGLSALGAALGTLACPGVCTAAGAAAGQFVAMTLQNSSVRDWMVTQVSSFYEDIGSEELLTDYTTPGLESLQYYGP